MLWGSEKICSSSVDAVTSSLKTGQAAMPHPVPHTVFKAGSTIILQL
jgi:hypothetical protein